MNLVQSHQSTTSLTIAFPNYEISPYAQPSCHSQILEPHPKYLKAQNLVQSPLLLSITEFFKKAIIEELNHQPQSWSDSIAIKFTYSDNQTIILNMITITKISIFPAYFDTPDDCFQIQLYKFGIFTRFRIFTRFGISTDWTGSSVSKAVQVDQMGHASQKVVRCLKLFIDEIFSFIQQCIVAGSIINNNGNNGLGGCTALRVHFQDIEIPVIGSWGTPSWLANLSRRNRCRRRRNIYDCSFFKSQFSNGFFTQLTLPSVFTAWCNSRCTAAEKYQLRGQCNCLGIILRVPDNLKACRFSGLTRQTQKLLSATVGHLLVYLCRRRTFSRTSTHHSAPIFEKTHSSSSSSTLLPSSQSTIINHHLAQTTTLQDHLSSPLSVDIFLHPFPTFIFILLLDLFWKLNCYSHLLLFFFFLQFIKHLLHHLINSSS
ncbi:hypothetical protein VP01_545g4 [Puccinia sorghi]|uniref:Uncharacterized protein n=1 Tax=Puccinia sorghi TaxID=27349 RepID=A0A0L6ULK5_9BASI|nr:hypothetical protein VP01_545g4 [Puccinia sorghi]